MARHAVPARILACLALGRAAETEIGCLPPRPARRGNFRRPAPRRPGRAIVPLTRQTSEDTQFSWWSFQRLGMRKPLVSHLARIFTVQDRRMVQLQRRGLRHHPRLMLIPDGDTLGEMVDADEGRVARPPPRRPPVPQPDPGNDAALAKLTAG